MTDLSHKICLYVKRCIKYIEGITIDKRNTETCEDILKSLNFQFESIISQLYAGRQINQNIQTETMLNHIIHIIFLLRDKNFGYGSTEFLNHQIYILGVYTYTYKMIRESTLRQVLYGLVHVSDVLNCDGKRVYKCIGSWKDLKRVASYIRFKEGNPSHHPMFNMIASMYAMQLKTDYMSFVRRNGSCSCEISLVAKWIPRETQKQYKWLQRIILNVLYPSSGSIVSTSKKNKEYRHIVTRLNTYLDTPEVHMTRNEWANIDFQHMTNSAHHRYLSNIMQFRKYILDSHQKELYFDKSLCYNSYMLYFKDRTNKYLLDEATSTDLCKFHNQKQRFRLDVERRLMSKDYNLDDLSNLVTSISNTICSQITYM